MVLNVYCTLCCVFVETYIVNLLEIWLQDCSRIQDAAGLVAEYNTRAELDFAVLVVDSDSAD
jgi:hypothetical protein